MYRFVIRVAAVFMLAHGAAFAQGMPISSDGTDPKTWDPKLDATRSGAKNHKVIFEDRDIRVLSVTVAPGEVEAVHHHRWPSVLVIDKLTRLEDRDAKGKIISPKLDPAALKELPLMLRVPPQAAHSVTNIDKTPLHLIRIEFKNGFPKS